MIRLVNAINLIIKLQNNIGRYWCARKEILTKSKFRERMEFTSQLLRWGKSSDDQGIVVSC